MKKSLRIIAIVLAIIFLSFIIFFYKSSAVQYIAYYSFFAGLIVVPLLWFFYCYKTLKKYLLINKPWIHFAKVSSVGLLVVFTLLTLWGFATTTGMEAIGIFWISIGFIVFLILNVLMQLAMVTQIKKKLKDNKS